MKRLITLVLVSLVLSACTVKPPSVRVRNERVGKINVQLQPRSGPSININDVLGGTTTGFREIPQDSYRVQGSLSGETNPPDVNFTADNDKNYTIVIVAGASPTMRVDSEDK
ncbi:MAG: hypothetical protein AAB393_09890 [Bacteroidota bacterium]